MSSFQIDITTLSLAAALARNARKIQVPTWCPRGAHVEKCRKIQVPTSVATLHTDRFLSIPWDMKTKHSNDAAG